MSQLLFYRLSQFCPQKYFQGKVEIVIHKTLKKMMQMECCKGCFSKVTAQKLAVLFSSKVNIIFNLRVSLSRCSGVYST